MVLGEHDLQVPITGADGIVDATVLVTGCGRSGTSLIGRILGTALDVEYSFEPGVLLASLALAKSLPISTLRMLWASYILDHVIVGSRAGRTLNLNAYDESSAYQHLSQEQIDVRLAASYSSGDLLQASQSARAVVKIPEIISAVPRLQSAFPRLTTVVTGREPNATMTSVLRKGWLSRASVKQFSSTTPSFLLEGEWAPFWVREEDRQRYVRSTELQRASIYYVTLMREAISTPGLVLVNYESLVEEPEDAVQSLFERVDLAFGPTTGGVIRSVQRRVFDGPDLLNELDPRSRREVNETWEIWESLCQPN